jgi:hypothetical protein
VVSISPSKQIPGKDLDLATTTSFQILSVCLFTNHSDIRGYIPWNTQNRRINYKKIKPRKSLTNIHRRAPSDTKQIIRHIWRPFTPFKLIYITLTLGENYFRLLQTSINKRGVQNYRYKTVWDINMFQWLEFWILSMMFKGFLWGGTLRLLKVIMLLRKKCTQGYVKSTS